MDSSRKKTFYRKIFYFSCLLVPFHVVHILKNAFRNNFAPLRSLRLELLQFIVRLGLEQFNREAYPQQSLFRNENYLQSVTMVLVFYSMLWCKYVETIYSSIKFNLKFDWSLQVTRKGRMIGKSFVWASTFAGTTTTQKLTNTPAVLFRSPPGQVVYFHKAHYYYIILSYDVQLFDWLFKRGVLKNFSKFTGKHLCPSLVLISL